MLKQEDKPTIKAVQLTGRENNAIWKAKDGGAMLMTSMTEEHLQKALGTVQTRILRNTMMLKIDFRLEQELKETARQRGLILKDYDEALDNSYSKEFRKYKAFLAQLGVYIKRKINEHKRAKTEA